LPDNYLLLVIRILLLAGLWVVDVGQQDGLIVRDGFVKQRPENPLLYLYQEGEKKRGQASKVARAVRVTLIRPSDASASTVLAGVVRKV
jgi:hypothetical protein